MQLSATKVSLTCPRSATIIMGENQLTFRPIRRCTLFRSSRPRSPRRPSSASRYARVPPNHAFRPTTRCTHRPYRRAWRIRHAPSSQLPSASRLSERLWSTASAPTGLCDWREWVWTAAAHADARHAARGISAGVPARTAASGLSASGSAGHADGLWGISGSAAPATAFAYGL